MSEDANEAPLAVTPQPAVSLLAQRISEKVMWLCSRTSRLPLHHHSLHWNVCIHAVVLQGIMGHTNIPATWTLCCCSNGPSEYTCSSHCLSTILVNPHVYNTNSVATWCDAERTCLHLLTQHLESKHEQKGQSKHTWLLPAAAQHSCEHLKWVLMNKSAGFKKKKAAGEEIV